LDRRKALFEDTMEDIIKSDPLAEKSKFVPMEIEKIYSDFVREISLKEEIEKHRDKLDEIAQNLNLSESRQRQIELYVKEEMKQNALNKTSTKEREEFWDFPKKHIIELIENQKEILEENRLILKQIKEERKGLNRFMELEKNRNINLIKEDLPAGEDTELNEKKTEVYYLEKKLQLKLQELNTENETLQQKKEAFEENLNLEKERILKEKKEFDTYKDKTYKELGRERIEIRKEKLELEKDREELKKLLETQEINKKQEYVLITEEKNKIDYEVFEKELKYREEEFKKEKEILKKEIKEKERVLAQNYSIILSELNKEREEIEKVKAGLDEEKEKLQKKFEEKELILSRNYSIIISEINKERLHLESVKEKLEEKENFLMDDYKNKLALLDKERQELQKSKGTPPDQIIIIDKEKNIRDAERMELEKEKKKFQREKEKIIKELIDNEEHLRNEIINLEKEQGELKRLREIFEKEKEQIEKSLEQKKIYLDKKEKNLEIEKESQKKEKDELEKLLKEEKKVLEWRLHLLEEEKNLFKKQKQDMLEELSKEKKEWERNFLELADEKARMELDREGLDREVKTYRGELEDILRKLEKQQEDIERDKDVISKSTNYKELLEQLEIELKKSREFLKSKETELSNKKREFEYAMRFIGKLREKLMEFQVEIPAPYPIDPLERDWQLLEKILIKVQKEESRYTRGLNNR